VKKYVCGSLPVYFSTGGSSLPPVFETKDKIVLEKEKRTVQDEITNIVKKRKALLEQNPL